MTTLAASLYDWFEVRSRAPAGPLALRADGESFVTLKEGRPEWLYEAVREAHDGSFPCDWVYEECRAACGAIDDTELGSGREEADELHEYADARVDIYTKDLYAWAAEFCTSSLFAAAKEKAEEMSPPDDVENRISLIQFFAIKRIASTMLDAWRERQETLENREEYDS